MDEYLYIGFLDEKSILVINSRGQMRKVYTPFRVQCIRQIQSIPSGTWVYVEEVFKSEKDRLIYRIRDQLLPYYFFAISINY